MEIEDIPGRPARRYCTAAHRAAARQARRASIQPDQQLRLAETLPWLREPDPEPARARGAVPMSPHTLARATPPPAIPTPSRPTPVPGRRSGLAARLGQRLPRRRGAIAVIGAAGILAGGYTVTSSQVVQAPGPTQTAPRGETSDGWAARAQVTLTSVDRQLDTIARTEAAWNSMPEHETLGTPVPVADLLNRKALLERRKAALQSQLDNYRALSRARADLDLSERNLDAVEQALQGTPTTGSVSSPDDAAALAALQEQRDLRLRQRDAKKLELAGLEGNVEKAAHAPLPDDGQQTTVVSNEVMDVIHGGRGGGPSVPTPRPQRPELVSGGREGQQGRERQATTTSAPPDPRGPRDESAVRPAGPPPQASGPGNSDARAPQSGDHGSNGDDQKGPVTTVVGKVGDTLGGAVDGLTGRKDTGSKDNGSKDNGSGASGSQGGGSSDPDAKDSDAKDSGSKNSGAKDSDAGGGGQKGPVTTVVGKVGDTLGGVADGLTGQKDNGSKDNGSKDNGSKDNGSGANGSGDGGAKDGGAKDGGAGGSGQKDSGTSGGGPIDEVGDTLGGAVDVLTGRNDSGSDGSGSNDDGSVAAGSSGGTAPDGAAASGASARSAPESPIPDPQQPSGQRGSDTVTSQRTAVGVAGQDDAAMNSALELAMTIVHSVPGGDVAAPAVEAAMREAMAPAVEQSGSESVAGSSQTGSSQTGSSQTGSSQTRASRTGSSETSTSQRSSGSDAGSRKKHEADSSGSSTDTSAGSSHRGAGSKNNTDQSSDTRGHEPSGQTSSAQTSSKQKPRKQESDSQQSGDEKSGSSSSASQDSSRQAPHKKRDPEADAGSGDTTSSASSTSWGTWPSSSSSTTSGGSGTSDPDSDDSGSSSASSSESYASNSS